MEGMGTPPIPHPYALTSVQLREAGATYFTITHRTHMKTTILNTATVLRGRKSHSTTTMLVEHSQEQVVTITSINDVVTNIVISGITLHRPLFTMHHELDKQFGQDGFHIILDMLTHIDAEHGIDLSDWTKSIMTVGRG